MYRPPGAEPGKAESGGIEIAPVPKERDGRPDDGPDLVPGLLAVGLPFGAITTKPSPAISSHTILYPGSSSLNEWTRTRAGCRPVPCEVATYAGYVRPSAVIEVMFPATAVGMAVAFACGPVVHPVARTVR